MSLTSTRSQGTTLYTIWLEHHHKGDASAFTVRDRFTLAIAYGPTDNSIAATRACQKLNDGTMRPNYAHLPKSGGKR